MGNKHKLIKKGLIELFPKNIYNFYDLFGGSGVVSLNVNSEHYTLNDFDKNLYDIYMFFKKNNLNYNEVNNKILNIIKEYDLPLFSTDSRRANINKEIREKYKIKYFKLREDYNKNKDIYKLLTLQYYAMSRTMRFNKNNEFNMPFGNGYYIEDSYKIMYKNFIELFNKNIKIENKDFKDISIDNNGFVYLDPPYRNTIATYSENNQWTLKDDIKLFNYIKKLDNNNIKFALSNVYENKGIINKELKQFVDDNNFKTFEFDDFSYCSFGKGSSKTKEVVILNY